MYTKVLLLFVVHCALGRPSHNEHHSAPYHGPLAKPVVLKSGYLADTQEVAAARSAHQAALEKQSYYQGYPESHKEYSHDDHDGFKYHGPTAVPHVLHDGHIADTHEVAAAREEHLAAVAKVQGSNHQKYIAEEWKGDHENIPYHGELAKPVVLKSGFLADTQEVTAAKQHHLQALHSDGYDHYYDEHY